MSAAATTRVVDVPVEPMTAPAFAPYGEVFGATPAVDVRRILPADFRHDGAVTVGTIWQPREGRAFSRLERHFGVTQGFVQLSGAPSVVCVAPPTDAADPTALPAPEDVRAFLIDPALGYLFHRGTWHSLDRYVLAPPGATFLILNVEPNPTQIADFETGASEMHEDLGGPVAPRALPWVGPRGVSFRLVL